MGLRSLALWSTLALACHEEPPPPTVDASVAEAKATDLIEGAPAAEATVAPVPAGEPVEIVLVWQGIGHLHRSFFSDSAAVGGLAQGLSGQVEGPANIYVRHDAENFVGQIKLQLRPGTLRAAVHSEGALVRLQDLAPITLALATYRSAVAGRYDVRVESFHVGIESFRGAHSCTFGVTGTPPPDGRVVSPCVEVDGQQQCGEPGPDGARFAPEVASVVRTCLDL